MRRMIAPLLIAPLVFGAAPVFAQSNPSAAQIIQSLTPHGNLLNGSTRGIRLAAPSAAQPTPAPASASAAATASPSETPARAHAAAMATANPMPSPAQQAAAPPSVSLTVDFALNSAKLTPQAKATLDQLGRALTSSELASYRFRIEGHTDTVGTRAYNKVLSQRRADVVAHYLTMKFGVQPTRLEAVGMGEQGLLVPTPPQTPDRRNRRVQVINLGA